MAHEFFDAMPVNVFEVSSCQDERLDSAYGRNEEINSRKLW